MSRSSPFSASIQPNDASLGDMFLPLCILGMAYEVVYVVIPGIRSAGGWKSHEDQQGEQKIIHFLSVSNYLQAIYLTLNRNGFYSRDGRFFKKQITTTFCIETKILRERNPRGSHYQE